jgi:hypothetical protein
MLAGKETDLHISPGGLSHSPTRTRRNPRAAEERAGMQGHTGVQVAMGTKKAPGIHAGGLTQKRMSRSLLAPHPLRAHS